MSLGFKFRTNLNISGMKKNFAKFKREAAEVAAGKILLEFDELLNNCPQRYGTYVASWRIAVGGRFFSEMGDLVAEYKYRPQEEWYRAGSQPAITKAKQANAGIRERIIDYILSSRAIYPTIIVFNNLPYWETAEYGPLRPDNEGFDHAFNNFKARLEARISEASSPGSEGWSEYMAVRL